MLSDVLQSPQDSSGDRGRGRQMITLRLETILVGDVAQTEGFAVGVGVAEGSLGAKSVLGGGEFGDLALFLRLNAISGLVTPAVRTVRVWSVQARSQDGDRFVLLWWRSQCSHCEHAERYDCLEATIQVD